MKSNISINQWFYETREIQKFVDNLIKSKELFDNFSGKDRDHLRVLSNNLSKILSTKCDNLCKNFILVGPPGAGKGLVASLLKELSGKPHISTGSLLRESKDPKVQETLSQGKFVSDDMMLELLQQRLCQSDGNLGIILDGYPRNMQQVEGLENLLHGNYVVFSVEADFNDIVERLSNRRVCSKCGKTFNLKTLPPKKENICDDCGGELIQRRDDKPDVIRDRLITYSKETSPVIHQYFRKKTMFSVNGFDSVNGIKNKIKKYLGEI